MAIDFPTITARTNQCPNPSFEVDTTGWGGSNTFIYRDTNYGLFGTSSLRFEPLLAVNSCEAVIEVGQYAGVGTITAGLPYTLSAYFYVPSGQGDITARLRARWMLPNGGTASLNNSTDLAITEKNTWVRHSITATANASATGVGLMIGNWNAATAATSQFRIDGIMIEQSGSLNSYFDGSSTNCSWSGTAHNSPSVSSGAGQTHVVGNRTWRYDGEKWVIVNEAANQQNQLYDMMVMMNMETY